MGTISDKLVYLNDTKNLLRDKINAFGEELTEENTFRSYADSLDNIFNDLPYTSDEGTSLTLNDTKKARFRKITLKGNTSQTGTPTPSSPIPVNVVSGSNSIEICGENLWGGINFSKTSATVSFTTNSDGTIVANGTATGGTAYSMSTSDATSGAYLKTLPAGTYKVSGGKSSTKRIRITDANGITIVTTQSSSTFTLENTTRLFVMVIISENETASNEIFYPMVSVTSTTFEPYQGNTYNIDLPVENLFDDYLEAGTINSSGNNSSSTTNTRTHSEIEVQANTTYTISTSENCQIGIRFYNSSKTFLSSGTTDNTPNTFTTPNETKYVRFVFIGTTNTSALVQLEKGTKANSYTPYGTTPIEMCKIGNYQDYFYKEDDKWYKYGAIGKVVLDGTEPNWATRGGATTYAYSCPNIFDGDKTTGLCSYWQFISGGASNSQSSECIASANTNTSLAIFTNDTNLDTVANLKTFLSNNKVPVWYVKITPTAIPVTYQPLIDQLNAIEKAQSKENQTNISQVNNDLPFILDVEAIKNFESSSNLLSMNTLNQPLNTTIINEPLSLDNIEPLEEEEYEES